MARNPLRNESDADDVGGQSSGDDVASRAAKYWKDVQAKTGFTKYSDYLSAYSQDRPHFRQLLGHLAWRGIACGDSELDSACTVFDLHIQNSTCRISQRSGYRSPAELLLSLSSPPEQVRVQIVLWPVKPQSSFSLALVDVLGLGLKIDPRFFLALIKSDSAMHQRHESVNLKRLLRPSFLIIGEIAVTIPCPSMLHFADTAPVVLIAGRYTGHLRANLRVVDELQYLSHYNADDNPPFHPVADSNTRKALFKVYLP